MKPWFGIVVHYAPIEDFDLDGYKKQAIIKIMEENNLASKKYQVEDIT